MPLQRMTDSQREALVAYLKEASESAGSPTHDGSAWRSADEKGRMAMKAFASLVVLAAITTIAAVTLQGNRISSTEAYSVPNNVRL